MCSSDLGGPEYELEMKGSAAACEYNIDKQEIDFGDTPFTEVREEELYLHNPGKVPASFNFNLTGLSRYVLLNFAPSSGTLKAKEKLKVIVQFRAGLPDKVTESILVEIAHFAPTKLTVRGSGTYPALVMDLPRQNEDMHRLSLVEAAKRIQSKGQAAILDGADRKSVV